MNNLRKIMVVSPSRSLAIIDKEVVNIAKGKLESLGYEVKFSSNCRNKIDYYNCASIEDRVYDLNEAIDSDCDLIMSAIGGYNSNQILPYLDYQRIKEKKKFICGFSDITAILNAIYAKTGLITFYGPHFSSFGMIYDFEYTADYFQKIMNNEELQLTSSEYYRDDLWYLNQEEVNRKKNDGMYVVNEGTAEGTIIGGNLSTFTILLGTEYLPRASDIILFVEDSAIFGNGEFLLTFDRNLESILQSSLKDRIRGIVIGRAQEESNMNIDKWVTLIKNKKELNNIPVVVNANFGHTTPIFTFPIGGHCSMKDDKILIKKRG